jgi:DNA-binding PadR family transcriptional regulator
MVSSDRDPEALLPLTPALFHVLLALVDGEKHGYAILKDVAQRTGGQVQLGTGTLYGIVKRLLADGLIRESAAGSTDRRRAYRLLSRRHEPLVKNHPVEAEAVLDLAESRGEERFLHRHEHATAVGQR